jgi:hypothetical protein
MTLFVLLMLEINFFQVLKFFSGNFFPASAFQAAAAKSATKP